MSSVVLVIYGIFLIAGGLMGFKKGSKVSLIAGLISGILIFAGVWITSVSPKPGWIFLTCVNAL
ncbi:MAG: TMEM14 family protein, partial [Candidatus Omnitrophica bacterium]|nr:TMEM14 family protein [Candidatus Omnitrophota bacterium]